MATIHKLTKNGATIFPATITDAVVHPQTGKTLTSMIKDYNVSELFPTEGIDGGNKYNLALAIQVLGTHLSAAQKTGGIKLTFISSVSPYPEEEYYLGKSSWSGNAADWDQRFEVGDVVADPGGSWEPGTAEAYIDQQIATLNTGLASEAIARQTGDRNLQTQINSEVTTRYNADQSLQTQINAEANTRSTADEQLRVLYENLTQSDIVVGPRPSSGQLTNVIYREPDQSHNPPQNYSDYMWYNNGWILMATYDNAIDDVPTAGSNNLVKSGGVYKNDTVKEEIVLSNYQTYVGWINASGNRLETSGSLHYAVKLRPITKKIYVQSKQDAVSIITFASTVNNSTGDWTRCSGITRNVVNAGEANYVDVPSDAAYVIVGSRSSSSMDVDYYAPSYIAEVITMEDFVVQRSNDRPILAFSHGVIDFYLGEHRVAWKTRIAFLLEGKAFSIDGNPTGITYSFYSGVTRWAIVWYDEENNTLAVSRNTEGVNIRNILAIAGYDLDGRAEGVLYSVLPYTIDGVFYSLYDIGNKANRVNDIIQRQQISGTFELTDYPSVYGWVGASGELSKQSGSLHKTIPVIQGMMLWITPSVNNSYIIFSDVIYPDGSWNIIQPRKEIPANTSLPTSVTVPDGCNYLIIGDRSNEGHPEGYYLPVSVQLKHFYGKQESKYYNYTIGSVNGQGENKGFSLKVMSYNVAQYNNDTSTYLSDEKVYNFRKMLNIINPDILGIQEDRLYIDNANTKASREYLFNPVIPSQYLFTSVGASIRSKKNAVLSGGLKYSNWNSLKICYATYEINGGVLLFISTHTVANDGSGYDSASSIATRLDNYTELFSWINGSVTLKDFASGSQVSVPQHDWVVIVGDMNTITDTDKSNLSSVVSTNNYTMANGGRLGWLETALRYMGTMISLDNVICSPNVIINKVDNYTELYNQLYSDHVPFVANLTLLDT